MVKSANYWLVKSEADCFSIQHLAASPQQTTCWSGVRNYQARNFMRDGMKLGDLVLYYHSGGDEPAVAGTATVVREAYPDHTAWDPKDEHCDPKASPANPIWQMVDLKLHTIFPQPIPLSALRKLPALKDMELFKRGSRLSVQKVTPGEFEAIVALAERGTAGSSKKTVAKKTAAKAAAANKTSPKKKSAKKTIRKTARAR